MLFCSSPSLRLRTEASSPTDPWWPTLARVAALRRIADELSPSSSHLVEFIHNTVVGSVPLPDDDLAMSLLFRQASGAATSVGLVARSTPSSSDVDDNQVWSCTVVDRSGPAATGFWWHDNSLRAAGEASGVVVDLLLRILGQPTPSCAGTTEAFWVADWLARIALAARMGAQPLSLVEVDRLCPPSTQAAPRALRVSAEAEFDEFLRERLTQRWASDLITQATSYRWHELHAAIVCGEVSSPLVPPSAAAWFDAGCFGRWCLSTDLFTGGLEPLIPTLLTSHAAVLVSDALDQVRTTCVNAGIADPTPLGSDELLL